MTRMVQLSDAAYARLARLKRRGESFSEVVLRLTQPGDLRALRGLRSPSERRAAERLLADADALDRP